MSLKVWLPLNGNLNNKGVSNAIFTNHDATVDTAGKIGQCYTFSGSSQYISSSYNFYNPQYSISVWIYSTNATATQAIICDRTTAGSGFAIFLIGGKIRIDPGGDAITWTTNYTYPTNTWFHLSITYDGTKVSYYINGEFQQEYTCALAENYWGTITSIGASQLSGSSYNNYLRGKLNDVRIYDHCLSAAEIREISQGLVLHYKLDAYNLFNPNTLTPDIYLLSNGSTSTSGAVGNWALTEYIPIKPNTSYIGYNLVNGGNGNPSICYYDINKTYIRGTAITANTPLNITTQDNEYYVRISVRKTNNDIYKMSFLEIPNIIEDSSGYGHTGTPYDADNISLSADTPRYNNSTNFSSSLSAINVGRDLYINSSLTYNCWIKSNAANKSRGILSCIQSRGVGFKTDTSKLYFTASIDGTWQSAYATTSLSNICNNNWHMITGVIDKEESATKIYVDGALQATTNYTGTDVVYNTSTVLWVGAEAKTALATPDAGWEGQMSDVRIYCTALSDDDILALYHTGAKVDNKGGIHTYEFNEISGSKITKSGIVKFNFIGENINFNQKTEIGKQIHPNLLKGSNQIGDMTIGKYGWISNGSASNIELLHDNIIHYSYNLSNTNRIPSITTNSAIACELGKTYTYTMELKCDQAIRLGTNVPMHFWAGARTTDVDTNTSCSGHLSGITYDYVLNHGNSTLPANTWVKIVTRITYPTSISESNYPYPALRCYVYGSVLPAAYTGEVNIWMRNCKVEEGTDSTPWVPHIDDGCSSIISTESGWINGTQLIEL